MASIHKRPNSPYYQAQFSVPGEDGKAKIIRVSTGKRIKKEAQAAAQDLEQSHLGGGADDLTQAELSAILKDVAKVAARGALSEARARGFVRKIYETANARLLEVWTVGGWVDTCIERKRKRTAPATLARYRGSAKLFREFMGEERLAKSLESVTRDELRAFQEHVNDGKRTPRTVNHYVKDVAGFFRAAVLDGVLVSSPAAGIEPLKEAESEREPFDLAELRKIYRACPTDDWRGVFLLGAHAGLRIGDAVGLKVGSVDMRGKRLKITTRKTGAKVVVPMHRELIAHFRRNPPKGSPEDPVFPDLSNRSPGGRKGLSGSFGGIVEKAGVDRGLIANVEAGAARTRYKKSFHSLRHTFTSQLANAGVSAERRMLLTAHSRKGDVHQLYTHTKVEELRKDVNKLPAITAA